MKLPDHFIVGLGNPGVEYAHTRHNVGFMVVDRLMKQMRVGWENLANQGLHRAELSLKGDEELSRLEKAGVDREVKEQNARPINLQLIKPQQFMNRSGETLAKYWSYFWKNEWQTDRASLTNRLWVVHDDLDIVLGQFKIQFGTGPKQHNGLLSIYQALGSEQFWHVRVGVDGRQGSRQQAGQDYVLGSFSREEKELVEEAIDGLIVELDKKFVEVKP